MDDEKSENIEGISGKLPDPLSKEQLIALVRQLGAPEQVIAGVQKIVPDGQLLHNAVQDIRVRDSSPKD